MARPFTILVVCTANVCRSPLAQVLLDRAFADRPGLVRVSSAGVMALLDAPMCAQSAAYLAVEAEHHAARDVPDPLLPEPDLILAPEREHRAALARLVPAARSRTFTLRQAALLAEHVVASVSDGFAPDGAPALPDAPEDRLVWLVEEMDASRGLARFIRSEDEDIEDAHGPADHRFVHEQVDAAVRAWATAARSILASGALPVRPEPDDESGR